MNASLSLLSGFRTAIDVSGLYNLVFFQRVNDFLRDEIAEFQARLLTDIMAFFGIVAANLMIIWILIQGFRIISGRSRDSMMALVLDSSRAFFLILVATGFGTAGPGVMAGVMLTLNKVAMALFTAFGPLFILCLIFEQTKPLFQRWLLCT